MATYVKGDEVTKTTDGTAVTKDVSYELFEKVGEAYNSLATGNEIKFEVSALGLLEGKHTLVVQAHADGYESSDYSNEVEYSVVIDLGAITWYIDNAEQTGKSFNYAGTFPGCAARVDKTAGAIRGVPINVVKFYPSAAGKMYFAKWVPGSLPVFAASIDIPAEDVYASAPSDGAGAKTYLLSNTITLAANEYLLCKWNDPSTTEDSAGFWVNAGGGGDYAVYVWNTADNAPKSENWGLPFSIGCTG